MSSSSSSSTTDAISPSQPRYTPLLTPSTHLQIKLTKDNYLSWKTAILPYINGNKILHYIDGTTAAPPQYIPSPTSSTILIPNPAFTSWFEIDQLLLISCSDHANPIPPCHLEERPLSLISALLWPTLRPRQPIPAPQGRPSQYSSNRGSNGYRGCGRNNYSRSRGNGGSSSSFTHSNNGSRPPCQIYFKVGHTASACWHRFEQQYQAPMASQPGSQAFVAATSPSIDQVWYPDTGANNHLTADLSHLNLNAEQYTGSDQVHIGNGEGLHIHHIGSSILCSATHEFFLKHILHVPHISHNLISVQRFAKDNNVFFEFHPSFFCVKDLFSGATLLKGLSKDDLYPFHSLPQIKPRALLGERVSTTQWHARLGHPSLRIVRQVLSKHHLAVSTNNFPRVCHACQLGKSHRLPFYLSPSRSQFPLDLLFTDVWGPCLSTFK
uniref:Uncharacterized protein n=1 Tax=Fagus sylvatica TaxID=28930 RepID=A0A2N9EM64_FAGSY